MQYKSVAPLCWYGNSLKLFFSRFSGTRMGLPNRTTGVGQSGLDGVRRLINAPGPCWQSGLNTAPPSPTSEPLTIIWLGPLPCRLLMPRGPGVTYWDADPIMYPCGTPKCKVAYLYLHMQNCEMHHPNNYVLPSSNLAKHYFLTLAKCVRFDIKWLLYHRQLSDRFLIFIDQF